ncbi:flagellar motor switch protein FliN [Gilvimarinus sp. 1_MG-2023]|uniref:flagellar motor switch protein FliN n=1 Tax=Gilvimarinus sp. 2_MG-2023 TaxID=3062666 RepID=UPI0026E42C13|nr:MULTISPECIES: flagellar motor switch protein FliN [unclassified Gilvimarinus]MDO6571886.1 flagellar motor switch protein FliN [Gilvimarinus sp. 2_MG-2023]MDO6745955.1 flagellar motor switch protein FliN [Gilvimarinus sp. 1_MG-2023]
MADEWAAAMEEQVGDESSEVDVDEVLAQTAGDDSSAVGFDELQNEGSPRELGPELDLILDIPVSISMEVGSTAITIRNLLQLNQGSVIELDRLAGEPLDVRVNGTLIAHGEVVVVNEKFGIRMTDVISPSERIKKLK